MQKAAKVAAGFAWVVLVAGGIALVRGDEPPGKESQCQCHEAGIPLLSKIPYISRIFKNVGVVHEAGCEAGQCQNTPCADQLERIGVDFELCQTCPNSPLMRFGPIELAICTEDEDCCCRDKECLASCAALGCEVKCCTEKCCAEECTAKCCAEKCAAAKASEVAQQSTACQCAGRDELWEHLVEMAAAKGAAEAALEAREEHSNLLDALVEMATKSAALEAKLEAQTEHNRIMDRVIQLAAENAQLKARVELAEIKTAMIKETLPVAIEKELLARRVAELEHRLATSDEGVRTAKKPNGKKAR
jgi:hypothetical protein